MWMTMLVTNIFMFSIFQWNARLTANGQVTFVDAFKVKPELICFQEAWLKALVRFCSARVCKLESR